ncbi:UDP-glucose 4-epimerase GalE [Candidatus Gottesmanbacteria bacterium RBG_13_45_10]|uniref:UDP-glucose 4-epimerase n=1 Tax=Candidatus Gottesmanbacteria bacterium RBG_13_45_10 TaxID=1798370 RepID=A0A1F5ZG41_9BACT|nr:MAG: UDP-glucose 4-epimerase GalE [Candidatus Gottesmanbacteria bacterium RBG_13_45_10]
MRFLVTGGAGYIGSITNWLLRSKNHETVIFDNMVNGHKEAVGDTKLIIGDLRSKADIASVFEKEQFDAVIHFAALALAGESMQKPFEYFHNNIDGGLNLLEAMRAHNCKTIIFSSTCAVNGFPKKLPVTEESPIAPASVYGASKRNFEEILEWYEKVYGIRCARLRYFNACGALPDGTLGEDHTPETHIIPVAIKALVAGEPFRVFGNDYHSPDGTCIRDYIHVLDLADAHLKAAEYIAKNNMSLTVNLGVGKGYSNMEILKAVEAVTGKKLKIEYTKRRWGDPDAIYADNTKAKQLLGWQPKYVELTSIIETAWAWHQKHPKGY